MFYPNQRRRTWCSGWLAIPFLMITISKWANRNPVKSRLLIASSHLLAVANAVLLGFLLFLFDWPASSLLVFLLVSIFSVAYLLYPTNKSRLSRKRYWQQKRSDFILALSYSLLIAVSLNNYLANEGGTSGGETGLTEATIMHSAVALPPVGTTTTAPLTKTERKEARRGQFKTIKTQFKNLKAQLKELKAEIRAWKKDHKGQKEDRGAVKALLLLLVIIVALALATLIAGLSCSLSCNGQEGLAVFVFLGGLAGITLLSIIAIKAVFKKETPAPAEPVQAK